MVATLRKNHAAVGTAVLLLAFVATYSNHFHNSFHFDDAHTIVNNAAIRDLNNTSIFRHE